MQNYGKIKMGAETLFVELAEYRHGGGVCVTMTSDRSGPFGVLSVNLDGHPDVLGLDLQEDEFVLNHDYLGDWAKPYLDTFLRSGLFEDTGKRVSYGFCTDVPVWRLSKGE